MQKLHGFMLRFVSFSGLRSNNKEFPFPFSFLLRVEKRVFSLTPVFFVFFCFLLFFAFCLCLPAPRPHRGSPVASFLFCHRARTAQLPQSGSPLSKQEARHVPAWPSPPFLSRLQSTIPCLSICLLSICIYLSICIVQSIHKVGYFLFLLSWYDVAQSASRPRGP